MAKTSAASAIRGGALFHRSLDHRVAEIDADHIGGARPREFEGEFAGTGGDIECDRIGWFCHSHRRATPSPIQSERHQRVDEVVVRHDGREHVADAARLAAIGSRCRDCGGFHRGRASAARMMNDVPPTRLVISATVAKPIRSYSALAGLFERTLSAIAG